jgi:hypothetical protein
MNKDTIRMYVSTPVKIIFSVLILTIMMPLLISITSWGQQNNYISNSSKYETLPQTKNIESAVRITDDSTPPSVNITYPNYPPTIMTGKIVIEGIAEDSGSGINNITAVSHTFPFDNSSQSLTSHYVQVYHSDNNSAKWSFPLMVEKLGAYRVVVTVTDKAGNENFAETTINMIPTNELMSDIPIKDKVPKIAFVRPTFTESAYQDHGFFDFYYDYGFPPFGNNITADLDKLTVKTPKSVAEFQENDIAHLNNITSLVPINGTELHDISFNYFPVAQKFWIPFINNVRNSVQDAIVTVIRDEDVHDGHIFHSTMTSNAFDVLLLFHNEYVTQPEYDNFKQFVKNGGTIVFIDANVFRAEVRYDRDTNTITLVKGHDWQFDGKAASRSVPERWYNETKQWVGSNYLDVDANLTFSNNPFGYVHFEEQFVNNPHAKVLFDYGMKFPKEYVPVYLNKEKLPAELTREDIPIQNVTVATYTMDYGKGKVVMLGLTGRLLADDPEFIKFFDNAILPIAICPGFKYCENNSLSD